MPVGAESFREAVRMNAEVFQTLKGILKSEGQNTTVGDEGGFAPNIENEQALQYIVRAIEKAGYVPGEQIAIALDPAASELFEEGGGKGYRFWKSNPDKIFSSDDMIELYMRWVEKYPIVSLEDGLDQNDWDGYVKLTKTLGKKIQVMGDDLFVTNTKRLAKGIEMGACNSILIKLNQIGTVSETIETVNMAKRAGYTAVVSHRSGETEDTFIADFTVAMETGQIKTGSMSRTDRIAKYNQLMRIEDEMEGIAEFWGKKVFYNVRG